MSDWVKSKSDLKDAVIKKRMYRTEMMWILVFVSWTYFLQ